MLTAGRAGYKWRSRDEKRREEEMWIFWDVGQNYRSSGLLTSERRWHRKPTEDADGVPHEWPAGRASKVLIVLTLDYPIKWLFYFPPTNHFEEAEV